MTEILEPGTQILYIPLHADGDKSHPDVEMGFVTSVRGDIAFCRYWSKHSPSELRTKANSEGTPIESLKAKQTHPKSIVRELLTQIQDEEKEKNAKLSSVQFNWWANWAVEIIKDSSVVIELQHDETLQLLSEIIDGFCPFCLTEIPEEQQLCCECLNSAFQYHQAHHRCQS